MDPLKLFNILINRKKIILQTNLFFIISQKNISEINGGFFYFFNILIFFNFISLIIFQLLGYWMFGSVWCDMHAALDVLLSTSSIMNLCLISLDRQGYTIHGRTQVQSGQVGLHNTWAYTCTVWNTKSKTLNQFFFSKRDFSYVCPFKTFSVSFFIFFKYPILLFILFQISDIVVYSLI